MKIILSPNPYRDKGLKVAQAAMRVLAGAGAETCICLPFLPEGSSATELPRHLDYANMEEELPTAEMALERVKFYRSEGRSLKEAAKLAAADTGYSKNELYELALRAKD